MCQILEVSALVKLGNDWDQLLAHEFRKDYYQQLRNFLIKEYRTSTVYPGMHDIYNALKNTAYEDVKVVLLGQDPYHGPGQAHGLAFSVPKGISVPPSLQNIYKELQDDVGCSIPNHGNLIPWAKQGVLLLNTCLTVRANKPNSHRGKGWEILTDRIISLINDKSQPVVFLLWGNNARSKAKFVTNPLHKVLSTVHPSPLSAYRGFFGCRHFSQTNGFLKNHDMSPIDWQIPQS